jgi:excisionase family DNA binding protein
MARFTEKVPAVAPNGDIVVDHFRRVEAFAGLSPADYSRVAEAFARLNPPEAPSVTAESTVESAAGISMATLIADAAQSAIHDALSQLRDRLTDSMAPCWWPDSVLREHENRKYFEPLMGDCLKKVHRVLTDEFNAHLKHASPQLTEQQAVEETCEELRKLVIEHFRLEGVLEPICVLDFLPDGVGGWPEAPICEGPDEFSSRTIRGLEQYIGQRGRFPAALVSPQPDNGNSDNDTDQQIPSAAMEVSAVNPVLDKPDSGNLLTMAERVAKVLEKPAGYPTMSVEEVAHALHRSKPTIYRYVEEGKLNWVASKGRIATASVKALLETSCE